MSQAWVCPGKQNRGADLQTAFLLPPDASKHFSPTPLRHVCSWERQGHTVPGGWSLARACPSCPTSWTLSPPHPGVGLAWPERLAHRPRVRRSQNSSFLSEALMGIGFAGKETQEALSHLLDLSHLEGCPYFLGAHVIQPCPSSSIFIHARRAGKVAPVTSKVRPQPGMVPGHWGVNLDPAVPLLEQTQVKHKGLLPEAPALAGQRWQPEPGTSEGAGRGRRAVGGGAGTWPCRLCGQESP